MKAFVFVFAFFILFKPLLPIAEYLLNYDYITKELCVDKNKIDNTCKGKCYLSKKMGEASKQQEPSDKTRLSYYEINNVFLPSTQLSFIFKSAENVKNYIRDTYNCTYSFSELSSIFHPPIQL